MPTFHYRAVHQQGQIVKGVVAAANESELARYLGQNRLELIEAREKSDRQQSLRFQLTLTKGNNSRALTVFCAQMRDLLQAGVTLADALRDIAASMDSQLLRHTIIEIERSINHGSGVTAAFASHTKIFPHVFIALLAAGERGGDLAQTFARLAQYTEARARMNERLKRALRYPLFLLAVAISVFAFMMVYVVPHIMSFLNSIDSSLPLMTRILVAVSGAVAASWWMIGLALLAIVALAWIARRVSEDAARILDAMTLRLPIIGGAVNKLILARFAHSFAVLFQSGIDVPESLRGARATLGNRALIARLDSVIERVHSGTPLSKAMGDLFPPFACRIMLIGEQSSQLGKSLADIAATYDREAAESTDRMLGALEPALTLMVGGLLAWIVLAVLGPIYGSLAKLNIVGQ